MSAKAKYIKENLARNSGDPRKFWQTIYSVSRAQKNEVKFHEFVNPENGETIHADNIWEFLNNYYVNIGKSNWFMTMTDQTLDGQGL